jgi:hypothetical protein
MTRLAVKINDMSTSYDSYRIKDAGAKGNILIGVGNATIRNEFIGCHADPFGAAAPREASLEYLPITAYALLSAT